MLLRAHTASLKWIYEVKPGRWLLMEAVWTVPYHTPPAFCINDLESCLRGWLDLGTKGRNRKQIGVVVQIENTQHNSFKIAEPSPFCFSQFKTKLQLSKLEVGLLGKADLLGFLNLFFAVG